VKHWNRWGPYLAERGWGTVREDYSRGSAPWEYFPNDETRSRAYRWNEDGLLGFCDRHQRISFTLTLWNGRDCFLKERLFGLTNHEGNHGEDVKECYFYLDNTPTQPHPFSFSAAPNGQFLRVSIKAAGDFTDRVRELAPGTVALLEGPLGAFTAAVPRDKYLMVAGGIGITPIRALIESLAAVGRDIVLLYSVKTADDLLFASELRALTAHCHFILSRASENREGTKPGETKVGLERGRIDLRMLARLVPDVQEREVFICGPRPMIKAVAAALEALQVRGSSIHYEQFA
jgi:ferredoxin-NADP reductase